MSLRGTAAQACLIFFPRVYHTYRTRSYGFVITLCYSTPDTPTVNYSWLITTCIGLILALTFHQLISRRLHQFSGITIQDIKLDDINFHTEIYLMNLVNCKSCNISPAGSVILVAGFIAPYIFSLCRVIFCFDMNDKVWRDFVHLLRAFFMPWTAHHLDPRCTEEPCGRGSHTDRIKEEETIYYCISKLIFCTTFNSNFQSFALWSNYATSDERTGISVS